MLLTNVVQRGKIYTITKQKGIFTMKKEIKGFVCGILVTVGCIGVVAAANEVWEQIDVVRNTMTVVVNGKKLEADNFLYNDTTYLPIRAVSEAINLDVQFDGTTNTAVVKEKGKEIASITKPTENQEEFITTADGLRAQLYGDKYYVFQADIEKKYKGDYAFHLKDDDTYKISWRDTVFFDNYPQGGPYNVSVELDWYNTVLQPWLASEGWRQ